MTTLASGPDARVPATDWRGRWAGWATLVAAVVAPIVAYVGNLGFAPLLALGGLAAIPVLVGRRIASTPYLVLLGALAWAAVSLAWSPLQPRDFHRYKDVEAFTGLKLVLELALYGAFVRGAGLVGRRMARASLLALGVGLALVGLLLLVEAAGGAGLYQWIKSEAHQATRPDLARRNVARATYAVALLVWPAGVVLVRRGWGLALIPVVAGLMVGALGLNVDAPVLAFAASACTFAGLRWGGRRFALCLAAAVVLYILAAPVVVTMIGQFIPPHETPGNLGKISWAARLDIWRFVVTLCEQKPWFGWGLDASRAFPDQIPLHPHDFALQMWLELGAVGATLAAAFWAVAISRVEWLRSCDPVLGAAAGASAVAYLVIGAISFGAWQEWWLALGALTAACISLARTAGGPPTVSQPPPPAL